MIMTFSTKVGSNDEAFVAWVKAKCAADCVNFSATVVKALRAAHQDAYRAHLGRKND